MNTTGTPAWSGWNDYDAQSQKMSNKNNRIISAVVKHLDVATLWREASTPSAHFTQMPHLRD